MEEPPAAEPDPPGHARGAPVAFGALIFGFGLAAGVLMAFSGYAVLQESASLVVTVFLAALFVVALVGSILFLLRRPITRRIYGAANAQMELFADPLSRVAESAIDGDPRAATSAARDLVRMTFARYAWLSTRRWIVASFTGLIAAMAALAGTALLFKQNELLAAQSVLLAEQNAKLQVQSGYLAQDVELSEAARNAQMAVEITEIAAALGEVLSRKAESDPELDQWVAAIPVLNPFTDLTPALIMRITSTSRAIKPYRFLDPPYRAHDTGDKLRVAMQPRRQELGKSYALMARNFDWRDPPETTALIDRPASPERAQLLQSLFRAGIREFELLNWFQLDLSFAYAHDTDLLGLSLQNGQLSFAEFDRSQIRGSDFRGAALENARFRNGVIEASLFSRLPGEDAKVPFREAGVSYPTLLAGADFSGAILTSVAFSEIQGGSVVFEGAVLDGATFDGAVLAAGTFRNAVLRNVDFTGADLRSVEFDGAFFLGPDPLAQLSTAAAPGTFRAERFEARPATAAEVMALAAPFRYFEGPELEDHAAAGTLWRLRRVQPFEAD